MKTGQPSEDGYGRWCDFHRCDHGPLYRCSSYPAEVLVEIDVAEERFRGELAQWMLGQQMLNAGS